MRVPGKELVPALRRSLSFDMAAVAVEISTHSEQAAFQVRLYPNYGGSGCIARVDILIG